ncbi:MAG: MlaD family protein [Lutibacter sp.]|nr:MCE family protein [Lutibacter sp.]
MKTSNTQKLSLGLFIFFTTIILVIALYLIGNKQNLFGHTFRISAVFNNVNGLILGNNVRYSGINIGTVKNIVMVNDSTICVDMVIEDKMLIHMKKNAVAAIGSDGLVGSMVINIVPGKEVSEALKPGDTIKSYDKTSTTDMLETLNTTNDNAAKLTSDLLKITTAIKEGKGTIGMLIKDAEMASDVKQTVENLKTASTNASLTITELKNVIDAINYEKSMASVLLSDPVSANQLKSVINNLEKSSEHIDSVITNLNRVVLEVKNGEGTINYMIKDTILVNNIDETMENIKEGSVRLNENMEALKHNFLFRGYFRKLEKQKLKEEKNQN